MKKENLAKSILDKLAALGVDIVWLTGKIGVEAGAWTTKSIARLIYLGSKELAKSPRKLVAFTKHVRSLKKKAGDDLEIDLEESLVSDEEVVK